MFLDGGPSFGAISSFAVDDYFAGASYTLNRDVILVDTRGTGLSQPRLGCPEFDQANQSSFFSHPFVGSSFVEDMTKAVAACHDRLTASGIDLGAYNTAESAADLDALRRALAYRRWNLIAISADGVLGLTYMRKFPSGIRSAIIDSGIPPQEKWNLSGSQGMSALLERVFAGCAANVACASAYPNLRNVFFRLVHELQVHPAVVPIPDFPGGAITFRVDGVTFIYDAFVEIFPGNTFFPETILPLLKEIWRSAHGELAQVYRERNSSAPPFNDDTIFAQGKTMSYACHDLIAFETRADFRRAARELPELAPDILSSSYGLPFGSSGCKLWHVGKADPEQHQPVESSIPTLVLAGEYDCCGVNLLAPKIPKTLENSFFYDFPASGHLQLPNSNPVSPCTRSIAAQFLDAPNAHPDSSCIALLPRFDFTP